MIWLATGALAVAPAAATRPGGAGRAVRRVRAAVAAAGLISLIVAVVRIVDPPGTLVAATTVAYIGAALTAVIAVTAAAALRRAG